MRMKKRHFLGVVWGMTVFATAVVAGAEERVLVAAASSLRPVLPEIMESFRQVHGTPVEAAFGSSGMLYRQIQRGAPFQVFLSADPTYTAQLVADGRTTGPGPITYARGRIVLFAPRGSPLDPEQGCAGLERLIEQGRLRRFAIPNPDHAPYGRAAREALEHCGLWERIQPALIVGENAAQAARFAAQPTAQGGIVPLSLARMPAMQGRGRYWSIPEAWHGVLRHEMVLLRGAGAAARAFFDHLRTDAARRVLEAAGFTVAGAAVP